MSPACFCSLPSSLSSVKHRTDSSISFQFFISIYTHVFFPPRLYLTSVIFHLLHSQLEPKSNSYIHNFPNPFPTHHSLFARALIHSKTIRYYSIYYVAQSSWHTHLLNCFYLSMPYKPARFNLNHRKSPEGGIYQPASENIYHQEQQRKTCLLSFKKSWA